MSARTVLGRLALLAGGLVLGLSLAEAILRWMSPSGAAWMISNSPALYDTRIFTVDEQRRLGLQPGATGTFRTPEFHTTVHINALGLRGQEPNPDALTVLAVGDSFTLGVQVPQQETFSALLSDSLSAQLGRPVEVLNGGVDSHGTHDATEQVKRVAAATEVDAVLLTFFLGNDLWDNCNRHRRRLVPGPLPQPQPPPLLRRVSHLYTWASTWQRSRALRQDPGQYRRMQQELRLFTTGPELNNSIRCTAEALQDFSTALDALQLPGVVGLAPPVFAIDPARLAPTFDLVGLDPATATVDAPAAAVAAQVPSSLTTVDLSAPLRAAADGPALYFTFDGHWTAAGHRVAAETYGAALGEVLQ